MCSRDLENILHEDGITSTIPIVGVKECDEGYPVELMRHPETGVLVVRAWNECQNNTTSVDLWSLIEWVRTGPSGAKDEAGFRLPIIRETL